MSNEIKLTKAWSSDYALKSVVKLREWFGRPENSSGYCYVIQSVFGGPIKVGFSRKSGGRIGEHQTSNPFKLRLIDEIASPATDADKLIHACLPSKHRSNGEWFYPTPEVVDLLTRIGFRLKKLRDRKKYEYLPYGNSPIDISKVDNVVCLECERRKMKE